MFAEIIYLKIIIIIIIIITYYIYPLTKVTHLISIFDIKNLQENCNECLVFY